MSVPAGYEPHFRSSPFTEPLEPLYSKWEDGAFFLGVRIAEPHTNARGMAHGALFTLLADNAMGLAAIGKAANGEQGGGWSALTVSITIDFMGIVQKGQWLEARVPLARPGKTLGFTSAELLADGELVAKASGVFRMIARRHA